MLAPTLDIDRFLQQRRIALVGLSRNPRDFSHAVARAFVERGYEIVPVHPAADMLHGVHCFASVSSITPPVEAALLMTSPAVTRRIAAECLEAGVRTIWMLRGGGAGAVDAEAVAACRAAGATVIAGACPLMFLPQTGWLHRLHGWFARERIVHRACDGAPRALPPGQSAHSA